jgi:molybdopterin-containing oxidoreductase family membrane subunit
MNQISLAPLANFNSAIPWGLWVSVYIWLVGISAGSFFLVMWGNLKNNLFLKKIRGLGITMALSTLLAGLLSIQVDLGHMERFYKLFLSPNPTSAMAWMVWLYGIYFIVLVMSLRSLKKEISKAFLRFSIIFALAIIVVESLLFAMPPGKHWHSIIFPLHFVTASLVSAIAALILMAGILWAKEEKAELLNGLSKIALPLIVINLSIEIIDMVFLRSMGHLKNWILLLGNIMAIILLLRHNPFTITLAGGIEALDILLSKYNGLISTQLLEPFKGFGQTYLEPRLQYTYLPTVFEYLVSIFLITLAAALCYMLYKFLPWTREG